MNLNKCFFLSVSLLSLLFVLSLFYFFIVLPTDFDKYQNMMRDYLNFDQNQVLTNHMKTAVQKDFFSRDHDDETHHRISCDKASLIIFEQDEHLQFSEAMQNIHGWIEEKQGNETWIRTFESKEGVFQYNRSDFTSPLMVFYSHPIQSEETTIQGTAKEVHMIFNHGGPLFQAKQITAQIHHPSKGSSE